MLKKYKQSQTVTVVGARRQRSYAALERKSLAVFAIALLASCTGENNIPAKVTNATGLFATERDSVIDGTLNHPAPKRLADLKIGTEVIVLSDNFGKDYWACHVRTTDASGWVLCTSLDYRGKNGT